MRKPTFCTGENKDAEQLCGNHDHQASLRLCFRCTKSTFSLLSKSKTLAIFCACTAQSVLDLFKNHIVGFLKQRLK